MMTEMADPDATTHDCDLLIIGAGLTGLSLACWLLQLSEQRGEPPPRVHLLEPRTAYQNDRTWCFWDREWQPFEHLISHRWFQWQVSDGERAVSQSSRQTPYALLPAGSVYQYAQARIESCPQFRLLQGVTVTEVSESAEGVLVSTQTAAVRARAVVDTRPPAADQLSPDQGFWQVFTGYEIRCPGHGFDVNAARLMDFQPCEDHVCFVYLLPLDADKLLVEWTEFRSGEAPPDCRAHLEQWLNDQNLAGFTVCRTESAALPMMPVRVQPRRSRVIRAGVGAGWMRTASGYHFASCQRSCAALAGQIQQASRSGDWCLLPPAPRKPWLDWMDRVFLRALRQNPESAPQWFLDLFAGTSAEQMARFMNDQPHPRDALAIVAALPSGPFLRAVFR